MRRLGRLHRHTGGQALVEFALVVPILLALLIAIIELGGAWRAMQVVTQAAREGARQGIVPASTTQQVTERVNAVLSQGGLSPAQAQLELRLRGGTGTLDTVVVRYPYPFRLLGPAVRLLNPTSGQAPPGSVRLSSRTVMRNE